MKMAWTRVFAELIPYSIEPVPLDLVVGNNPLIIVQALSEFSQPSWRKAGWLQQKVNIPEIGTLKGVSRTIQFGTRIYEFPLQIPECSLDFQLVDWLRNVHLSIWLDV